jgi:SSS family solute:Na+ symporter
LGVIAFLADLPLMGEIKLLTEGWGIPFMMQAWWGFCICSAIFVMTSYMTQPPAPAQVDGLTWANPLQVIFHGRISGWGDPRLLAGLLFLLMVILYAVFR